MHTLAFGPAITIDIVVTLMNMVAIPLTFVRFVHRKRTKKLWWDDWTAALAGIFCLFYIVAFWLFGSVATKNIDATQISPVIKFYISVECYYHVLYLARMSIALGIARVFQPGDPTRRTAFALAFFLGLVLVILQVPIITTQHGGFFHSNAPTNYNVGNFSKQLSIVFLSTNSLCDLVIVAIPLYRLWHVNLPPRQRRLILAGFAASTLTLIAMIIPVIFQFAPKSWEPAKSGIRTRLGNMEAAVALTSCNLLVVLTYFDNLRRRRLDPNRSRSLQRPHASEMVDMSCRRTPSPHSNEMPSEIISTLILTEISSYYGSNPSNNNQEFGDSVKERHKKSSPPTQTVAN